MKKYIFKLRNAAMITVEAWNVTHAEEVLTREHGLTASMTATLYSVTK